MGLGPLGHTPKLIPTHHPGGDGHRGDLRAEVGNGEDRTDPPWPLEPGGSPATARPQVPVKSGWRLARRASTPSAKSSMLEVWDWNGDSRLAAARGSHSKLR